MTDLLYKANYYPVGDIIVVSICIVMAELMVFSYNRKSRSFVTFLSLIGLLVVAAYTNVTYNMLALTGNRQYEHIVKVIRCFFHAALFAIFVLYVVYIIEVTHLEKEKSRRYLIAALVIYLAVVAADVITSIKGRVIRISENGLEYQRSNIFFYGYIAFVSLIAVLMFSIRNRLYRKVMLGFYGSMAVSFVILMIQGLYGQSSFTVATFLYPVIAMFYIMHSNPYDARSGAVDSRSLDDIVRYYYRKGTDFMFMSLYLPDFDEEGRRLPEDMQATIRQFSISYFRRSTLFQMGPGFMLLLFTKKHNPDYEARIQRILKAFQWEQVRFGYDYKIVIGQSMEQVSRSGEYGNFIREIHQTMPMNSIRRVEQEDVNRFSRYEVLMEALSDIAAKRDLNDPRVLVYCQPVYNIHTERYDTAEALMRLRIDGLGMVFPDQFIPLAEENGQIHVLTEIILNKTCEAVKSLLNAGYAVTRVSVNVSAIELKGEHFCEDIVGIIQHSGIPGDRIAIELTESRTDSDFDHMKQMIEELRHHGIKFYLDDFGTGYSNMERIMEMPFDIIKFDRSLVLASEASERSRKMVQSLANMFAGLDYSVLYEGVEKDSDERMCIDMAASYLQGYKYSRPVPIEELEHYFSHMA